MVVREGTVVGADELIEHCRSRIASYKKPRSVVIWPELPKSPAGKILRRTVREQEIERLSGAGSL